MKTSVIASMLLASMALAAPLERRARLTKTEIITTTVYSTTTVYDDEPAPAPTSSQGLFYEQPPSSAVAVPTSAAPIVPVPAPSSAAPVPAPSVQAQPQPQVSQAPASSAPAPAPVVTSAAPVVQPQPSVPAAAPTSAAPAPAPAQPSSTPASSSPSTGSYTYTDVDLTVYNGYGGKGACETTLNDSDMFVALSQGIFGPATYNVQTGAPTNKWCGVSITIEYNGKTVTAPVQDRCAGCAGENDVDVSPAVWTALGLVVADGGRYKANWSVA